MFRRMRSASKRLPGLHIGSGGTKNLALRRWPVESYRALIKRINQSHPDWVVLLFGGPGEREEIAGLLAQNDPRLVLLHLLRAISARPPRSSESVKPS